MKIHCNYAIKIKSGIRSQFFHFLWTIGFLFSPQSPLYVTPLHLTSSLVTSVYVVELHFKLKFD